MRTLDIGHQAIPLDNNGFLQNTSDWTPEIASILAAKQNIMLTPAHWEIITLTQQFYLEYHISPNQRPFVKYIELQTSKAKGNSLYLMALFTGSPAKIASLIAGLPKPDHCF